MLDFNRVLEVREKFKCSGRVLLVVSSFISLLVVANRLYVRYYS